MHHSLNGSQLPLVSRLLVSAILLATASYANEPAQSGVIVESVLGSSAQRAGISPGDLLLRWRRSEIPASSLEENGGVLESPFDLDWLIYEEAPREALVLEGRRGGSPVEFRLENDFARIVSRPLLQEDVLAAYREAQSAIEKEDFEQAVIALKKAFALLPDDQSEVTAWLLLYMGRMWTAGENWERADEAFRLASEQAVDSSVRAIIWSTAGSFYVASQRFEEAADAYDIALENWQIYRPEGLGVARVWGYKAEISWLRSELRIAAEFWRRAIVIQERLAPLSYATLQTYSHLGLVAYRRGDLAEAKSHQLNVLNVLGELAPGTEQIASCLTNLAVIAREQGNIERAEGYQLRALAILEKVSPESISYTVSVNNLAELARVRGDLQVAEGRFRQALTISERLNPESLDVATKLTNLAVALAEQGKLEEAARFHKRSLAVRRKLAAEDRPDDLGLSHALNNLATLEISRRDLDAAEIYLQEALQISERELPGSLDHAIKLTGLGLLANLKGRLGEAEEYHLRALAIREKLAPEHIEIASNLTNLGSIALERGELDTATAYFERSRAIYEKVSPGSIRVVVTLVQLGTAKRKAKLFDEAKKIYEEALGIMKSSDFLSIELALIWKSFADLSRDQGTTRLVAEYLRKAIDALEAQVGMLGGSYNLRGSFRARYIDIYREAVAAELAVGSLEDGFRILEQARGRSFLQLFSERALSLAAHLPEELDLERRRLGVLYDRAYERSRTIAIGDEAEREAVAEELVRLRLARDELKEEIRKRAPAVAAVQYPKFLEYEEVRAVLDPGTVLLAYNIAETRSDVLVVGARQLKSFRLTLDKLEEGSLRESVLQLQNLMQGTGQRGAIATSRRESSWKEKAERIASELFEVLVKPAEAEIENAERLLIISDGPLNMLPFGALIRHVEPGVPSYLVEWKPIHTALSSTVYSGIKELRKRRSAASSSTENSWMVAAFGDPNDAEYIEEGPAERAADPQIDYAVSRACGIGRPLAHTGKEIEHIEKIFGADRTVAFLGRRASEQQLMNISFSPRILHFATHGCLDDRFPLNSYLVLSKSGDHAEGAPNGLLQAWEIIENFRTDADLVVLSACSTALGSEQGGEGLIGLSRAFQIAGARTVIASFWDVDDQVTAELMKRFYEHLASGKTKDEALRAAQIELIHHEIEVDNRFGGKALFDASDPYFWAGFQVIGDFQ